jgi:hypothetical protein
VIFCRRVIRELTLKPGQQDLIDRIELKLESHKGNHSTQFSR